jgi:hypothetical protein
VVGQPRDRSEVLRIGQPSFAVDKVFARPERGGVDEPVAQRGAAMDEHRQRHAPHVVDGELEFAARPGQLCTQLGGERGRVCHERQAT